MFSSRNKGLGVLRSLVANLRMGIQSRHASSPMIENQKKKVAIPMRCS